MDQTQDRDGEGQVAVPGPSPTQDQSTVTEQDFLDSTTTDISGLAEDIAAAENQEFEQAAVSAQIPGVASGLVGFDDVTGERGTPEEELESVDQQMIINVVIRALSALALLAVFGLMLMLGGWWFSGLVIVLLLVALAEFYTTARMRQYAPVAFLGFLTVIGAGIGSHVSGAAGFGGFMLAGILLVVLFYAISVRHRALENAGVTILGMLWVGLGCFAIIIFSPPEGVNWSNSETGPLILLAVILTAVFDIGAFFVGRGFGNRPLAPKLSPGKTVEGLVGAVVLTVVVAAFLSTVDFFEPDGIIGGKLDFLASLVIAMVVVVLSVAGDAAESLIKRLLTVKDMGTVLPGHGGLLDRFDGLLFVLPGIYVTYLFLEFLPLP